MFQQESVDVFDAVEVVLEEGAYGGLVELDESVVLTVGEESDETVLLGGIGNESEYLHIVYSLDRLHESD